MAFFKIITHDTFLIFDPNKDCGCMSEPTSIHNLCFIAKNKKNNVYPCKPHLFLNKEGFQDVQDFFTCVEYFDLALFLKIESK